MSLGISAAAWAGIGTVGSLGLGAYSASKGGSSQSGNQTTTNKQELDPRIAGILFGDGTDANKGLLSQYQGMLGKPQDPALAQYGQTNLDYLKNNGAADMGAVRNAATGLLGGTAAPQAGAAPQISATGIGAPAWATGNMVQAPSQNNMNLAPAYDRFINGDAGANPYLTKAIQGGIGQSQQAFQRMQEDSTRNLRESILPSIGSNAVLANQYGGSRQGIAEGRAVGDFAREQQRAIENFGNNNTTAAVGAQAGAFDRGQDRSLSAMQGLGAQQYGVAQQDAATKNAAEFGNVASHNAIQEAYAGRAQQASLANQGVQQQTNLANLGASVQTNAQNQNGVQAGAGLLGGLSGGAYGVGQNQDSYALNQAGKVNGLLAPYVGLNGTSTTSQPLYENKAGNMLGGAAAGLGIAKQFGGLLSGWGSQTGNPTMNAPSTYGTGTGSGYFDGYGWVS